MNMAQATLGGGCFWCLEAAFKRVKGIHQVVSGYAGGEIPDPSYEQICAGNTGHAEVVQLDFDAEVIHYPQLLILFFALHDPTTLNRQGADVGPQYCSIILYHDDQQRTEAQQVLGALQEGNTWPNPIVTELAPLKHFYPAERYHQAYYQNNPGNRYCQSVIDPKLKKFFKQHESWIQPIS